MVANWKLYFKKTSEPIKAEAIDTAIIGVVNGDIHTKYVLRRTPHVSDGNMIKQNIKYFSLKDIDECELAGKNDCDKNAKCQNIPGNFKCLCRSNYDDISNMTALPPGRQCRLDPDRPEENDLDLQYNDVLIDNRHGEVFFDLWRQRVISTEIILFEFL